MLVKVSISKRNKGQGVKWLMPVITVTQEVEIRKIKVHGQPRQKVDNTPPPSISRVWCYMPVIPTMQETCNRNISPRQNMGDHT
jgi:hypothetical protein